MWTLFFIEHLVCVSHNRGFNSLFLYFVRSDLSIDVMDVSGEHQLDVLHSMSKQRLTFDGNEVTEKAVKTQLARDEETADGAVKAANKTCLR